MTTSAGATITATFSTRRQADLAIEQLVQEHGIDRSAIFVTPVGDDNSAGSEEDCADAESGPPGVDPAGDPALAGGLDVSVDLADEGNVAAVRAALQEHGGEDIATE
ncbi:hypothetical protein [Sphingomonas nostoxanthinifaciens]|uniref:hypothetical protein n=1 Tax=Sphingomonas nostoxanthinifaciens TaxID=2872652 RepID=UPI001CC1D1F7|nr:hypothetical protein [Sphingomonas nostoxanthinifaciens]UAK25566.1 hypothetical protein K8P63_05265 [Sphingomonas nostoxanthinifaciens]